jgi:hypothetical protein
MKFLFRLFIALLFAFILIEFLLLTESHKIFGKSDYSIVGLLILVGAAYMYFEKKIFKE